MDKVDYEAKLAQEVSKLKTFQESLAQEFKASHEQATDGEPELEPLQVAKQIEQKLLKSAMTACDTIVHLVEFADKDSVRFSVSKYVLDRLSANPNTKGDTLDDLIKQLTAPGHAVTPLPDEE